MAGPIEYVITLNSDGKQEVNLRCIGKVVRAERADQEAGPGECHIAATLERYEFVRER